MSSGCDRGSQVSPGNVLEILGRNMLVDGYEMVIDLEKSQGAYMHDSLNDRTYIDFFSFFASTPLGMNHPRMKEPAFLEKLQRAALHKVSNADFYTVEMAEFVDTFAKVALPSFLRYVFFIEGGALAVENALKTAFDWKVRKNFRKGHMSEKGHQVIHFREAFHGRSGYTMSLTNTDPVKTDYFPKFHWPRVHNPKLRFPVDEAEIERVKAEEELSLAQIRQAIRDNPDDIAAIIIEPIQAEGGDNHFRAEFLAALRQIADESDILLIFDEIQTGIGITGKMWAHQHFDVQPDILVFGKKTQVCGIAVSTRIDEVEENVFHKPSRINSTWGGNLCDMVRSAQYLRIIQEDHLVQNAAVQGEYLLRELTERGLRHSDLIGNVRGRGLFCALEFGDHDLRNRFVSLCHDFGVIVLPCGPRSVRFRPPLDIHRDAIDEGLACLDKAIASL